MAHSPSISVIMPVYNAGKFLREAIDSILGQTHTDLEFIIVNDCSADESEAIILSYTDPRIVYIKHEVNKGVVAAMNTGIALVKAPLLCIMHADDISLPERLAWQKEWLERHPES
ncbi:MAG: glycosyltransferase family 2 protein, partial [Chitinophagaceae bacterium]|nr:glycosyltransferase family 2 protein [Chitinophagaceae bacterium]